MKNIICILIIGIISLSLFSQQSQDTSYLEKRSGIYSDYLTFKDTMTVNTWMNYRLLIQKLEEILKMDNRIIYNTNPLKEQINVLENKNFELLDEINAMYRQNEILNDKLKNVKSRQNIYIILFIIFALLLIAVILFVLSKKNKFLKARLRLKYLEKENTGLLTDREKFEKWYDEERKKNNTIESELEDLETRFDQAADQLEELGKILYKEKDEREKVEKELKRILGQLKNV